MTTNEANIVLAGFMGTGKSTVGRLLSERLGRPFIDADELLENEEGRSIPDIFASEGEAAFRQLEKALIQRISSTKGQIISTGGGALKDPDNRAALEASGVLFCLRAEPETILRRVENESHRPLLESDDRLKNIRDILAARKEMYGQIRHQVDTDGQTPQQVVETILSILNAI